MTKASNKASARTLRSVVVVDGTRTPFCRSGTAFMDLSAYQLGTAAVSGLMHKTRLPGELVDLLVMGTVIADPATSNLGREVVLGADLPSRVPAYTIAVACVSSLQAFVDCVRAIETGAADVAIAAGAETLSDAPIRYTRAVRKRLMAAQKIKGAKGYADLLKGLSPKDLLPEPVAIAEFSTGEAMGVNCERLAKRLGVSREEQDEFALASHQRAAAAMETGCLDDQVVPTYVPGAKAPVTVDNGVRGESTLEKLAKLRPAFDKTFGTVTAGNSSFLTDGASAVLLMSEEAARAHGLTPLATVRSSSISAQDPLEELLLGPAFTIPAALATAGLTLGDMEVLEIHEAFAAQVLSVKKVLEDESFCRERLGLDGAVGSLDSERMNAWGGSLSLGHPFGATGARLIINCCRRLVHEDARYGLVAACAAGAIGIGLVLERWNGGSR